MTTLAPPPPAPANPPPPLSPGGRSAVRVTLIVAAAVITLGALVALSALAWGVTNFRVITDSKALPPALRALVVDTGTVPMAVRLTTDRDATEPRADLRMVNSTRAAANPLALTSERGEARLTITGEASEFLQWTRAGELTVVLPPDLARRLTVTVEQKTGVLMARADLDQLVARTDDGAVVLSGAARRVEIHNVNGEVVAREPIAVTESFSATTVSGDVVVDFAEAAPRSVDINSQDGDIVVGLPANGTYLVNADSDAGRGETVVRVPRTADRDAADAQVTARSQHGDVVIDDLR
ncbi:DUF4097 family beta strand repeat protein [Mycolicibacterium flavescens]|uniref:DUF4097 domain-containing protein n=1 Tax=Mycolicibacterium flavescens TaxID=1776 RepID=A0A1E3RGA4_MYCFV|nr:DUF4097 family beta strand repeat-containing protein [Mycolicibacterium flavescens]MCV7280481.1 DUF4097 family beta strand repeat protein [Mycolicibacterium flavescens]ODQ88898.1 hypothetical protein BHQ18_16805 [Mycolicibacterium flavescens]